MDFDPSTLQVFAALTTPSPSALAISSCLHVGTEEGAPVAASVGFAVGAAVVGFAVGAPVGKGVGRSVDRAVGEVVGGGVSAPTPSVRLGASMPAGRVKVMSLPGRGAGVIIPTIVSATGGSTGSESGSADNDGVLDGL